MNEALLLSIVFKYGCFKFFSLWLAFDLLLIRQYLKALVIQYPQTLGYPI
jgi:hypothetical protein